MHFLNSTYFVFSQFKSNKFSHFFCCWVYINVTAMLSRLHFAKIICTAVGNSIIAMVTGLKHHFACNSREVWHKIKVSLWHHLTGEEEYGIKCMPSQIKVPLELNGAPFRGYGYVPLRIRGNVVRRMGTQQQQ